MGQGRCIRQTREGYTGMRLISPLFACLTHSGEFYPYFYSKMNGGRRGARGGRKPGVPVTVAGDKIEPRWIFKGRENDGTRRIFDSESD